MSLLAFLHRIIDNDPRETRKYPANEGVEADMKSTYLVRLADLVTQEEQSILVLAYTDEGMQEFVDSIKKHPEWPQLKLTTPRVVPGGIRKLAIKRPLPRTTLTAFVA